SRNKDVQIKNIIASHYHRVVLHVGRNGKTATTRQEKDLVGDMKFHGARDDIDDLFIGMSVGMDGVAGAQPGELKGSSLTGERLPFYSGTNGFPGYLIPSHHVDSQLPLSHWSTPRSELVAHDNPLFDNPAPAFSDVPLVLLAI